MKLTLKKVTAAGLLAITWVFQSVTSQPVLADTPNYTDVEKQVQQISHTLPGFSQWDTAQVEFLWTADSPSGQAIADVYQIKADTPGYVIVAKNAKNPSLLEFGETLPPGWLSANSSAAKHYYLGPGGCFVQREGDQADVEEVITGDTLPIQTLHSSIPQDRAGVVKTGNRPAAGGNGEMPNTTFKEVKTPVVSPDEALGIAVLSATSTSTPAQVFEKGGWTVENFSTTNYYVAHAVTGVLTVEGSSFARLQNVFLPSQKPFYASTAEAQCWVSSQ